MSELAYFMDLELETEGQTLHPRPETEILVEKTLEIIKETKNSKAIYDILDIGTGSGNIAISLTKHSHSSRMVALDICENALRIAQKNADKYGIKNRIKFIKSNVFDGLSSVFRDSFDLIVSNPPYVSREDFKALPERVKEDPYRALYGGLDGMNFYRKIVKGAPYFLKKGGGLLMEIGYGQAQAVKAILENSGCFTCEAIYDDYAHIERIVRAKLK